MIRKSILFVCLATFCAVAQQPATDPPASREDVLKLMEVMRVRAQMEPMVRLMRDQMPLMTQQAAAQAGNITAEQRAQLEKEIGKAVEDTIQAMTGDAVFDDIIPIYQKHFTKSEVEAIITFYSSPAGKSMLDKMPAVMKDTMQVSMSRGQAAMGTLMARVDALVKQIEEQNKTTEPKPAPPTVKPKPAAPATKPKPATAPK